MSATLESFEDKLNVDLTLASARYRDVVAYADERKRSFNSLDREEIVGDSCGNDAVIGICLSFKIEPGDRNAVAINSRFGF